MQVQDHGQIQPAFTAPDIAEVTGPFLVWLFSREVPIQQVGCEFGVMVTVGRHLVAARSDSRYAVLAHWAAHTTMTGVQANPFQLFSHPWPGLATQTET